MNHRWRKTVEGVASHKKDVTQFVRGMENVRQSYHLNGQEVQQVWMAALGSDLLFILLNLFIIGIMSLALFQAILCLTMMEN